MELPDVFSNDVSCISDVEIEEIIDNADRHSHWIDLNRESRSKTEEMEEATCLKSNR